MRARNAAPLRRSDEEDAQIADAGVDQYGRKLQETRYSLMREDILRYSRE